MICGRRRRRALSVGRRLGSGARVANVGTPTGNTRPACGATVANASTPRGDTRGRADDRYAGETDGPRVVAVRGVGVSETDHQRRAVTVRPDRRELRRRNLHGRGSGIEAGDPVGRSRHGCRFAGRGRLWWSEPGLVYYFQPTWSLLDVFWWIAIPTIILFWLDFWLDRRRTSPGHCLRCGYDLRASKGMCPECGATRRPREMTRKGD